ncbi:MAG: DegT/DnrJ/EryC1/StrS family aminotransferase [Cytophagia bacterium]|nr:DegT/DnrJ/EryC1/StrS family aminotransferase [Cytophagia bacterium]
MIPVTKPFCPPKEKYIELINGIWERNWLTNNGPLLNQFELNLKKYLGLEHLLFLGNGTIAIQIALKALKITKKVITTPFSHIATTSSLAWEGCEPVFVEIDPQTLNIDPAQIERAIDEDTEAILATHCFGNPCDIDGIDSLAKKYNLKVIYDAAHCFGTTYRGKSIFDFGDISTTSLHATKIMHSIEGGLVFTKSPELLKTMYHMRNFGHNGPEDFTGVGINGKNSEFHAAMGLLNLQYVDGILERRERQYRLYNELLLDLEKENQLLNEDGVSNFSYYPIILPSEDILVKMKLALEASEIFPRRYFYPSLSSLSYLKSNCLTPVSDSISKRVLCLPLYHSLTEIEQRLISNILLKNQN